MTDYASLSDKALLARIARNADKLDATDVLYAERVELFKAARDSGARTPIGYEDIAAAAKLSTAMVWKAMREDRRRQSA